MYNTLATSLPRLHSSRPLLSPLTPQRVERELLGECGKQGIDYKDLLRQGTVHLPLHSVPMQNSQAKGANPNLFITHRHQFLAKVPSHHCPPAVRGQHWSKSNRRDG